MHDEARRRYGHPLGRRHYRKHYAPERRAVDALFRAFPDHPDVRTACEWIAGWLRAAALGDKSRPGYVHVARLARYDVQPLDVLAEVCAVWLFAMRNPRTLPDDERTTFALAVAMLFLAPRERTATYSYAKGERRVYKDAGHTDRAAIGNALRLTLAPLLVNVVRAIEEREQQQRERAAAFGRTPFISTNEEPTKEGNAQ
jgi:hypothetical protein